jgi:hypothetical protein
MESQKGFLLVTMEPPPELEEEFNDWYDLEHIPGRGSILGFETARRFVCISGWPKYLAFYDLAGIGVLDSPFYQQAAWASFSPWTKRLLGKVRGQYRGSGTQIYPGDALSGAMARLILIRFRDVPDAEGADIVAGLQSCYEGRKEVSQLRVMRSDYDNRIDYLAMIETHIPLLDPRPNAEALGASVSRIDLVNEYVPYWQRGPLAGVTSTT